MYKCEFQSFPRANPTKGDAYMYLTMHVLVHRMNVFIFNENNLFEQIWIWLTLDMLVSTTHETVKPLNKWNLCEH